MNTKTYRAPLALAIVALFATSLVPISGADSPTTLYTFHTGAPGEPTWMILKLDVTQPGVRPSVRYESSEFRCPASWGSFFMTGTPADAVTYNGLMFDYSYGRTGADVYTLIIHTDEMTFGGAEACRWNDRTVNYGELPVGTVYMLQLTAGIPFVGVATLTTSGPGVEVVGVSSGRTSIYRNETDFAGTFGVVTYGPPFCGGVDDVLVNCAPDEMNPGGTGSASVQVGRQHRYTFKHHPFVFFSEDGAGASNASMRYPTGQVEYMRSEVAEVGGFAVLGKLLRIIDMGPPRGDYFFRIEASATVGDPTKAGWHLTGADIWFPEEVA